MNAHRPLSLISLAFGIGAYTALAAHVGTPNGTLFLVAFLIACVLSFAFGSVTLGSRRKVFVRGSAVIALVYGAVTYAIAFVALLFVYQVASGPSLVLLGVTALAVAFVSGSLFVCLFARKKNEAS